MTNLFFVAAIAAADPTIIVSASREPIAANLSGAAVSVIDRAQIEAHDLPAVTDLLRLTPSLSVSTSGPLGAQTQVRLRGAESNHTLLVVDGIELNDPGSSADARFETLLSDAVERIEIIRGPQSALWGPEAIGGVIKITTLEARDGIRMRASGEYGARDTLRLGSAISAGNDTGSISLHGSWLDSDGIDIAGQGGDKDGFKHREVGGKGVFNPAPNAEIGASVRHARSTSAFDGYDYITSRPADADLESRHVSTALRGYGNVSFLDGRWSHRVEVSFADMGSLNRRNGDYTNRTDSERTRLAYQSSIRFETGIVRHRVTAAAETEKQKFRARDVNPLALSNQRQSRNQDSLIGEYRLEAAERAAASISVRHDDNNRFKSATTWRAASAVNLPRGFQVHASYGEGVADPTFTELFGYFPDFFVGNPNLKPERARGFDVGIGWKGLVSVDITYHHSRLTDEIVSTYDFMTGLSGVANATGKSRREGIEVTTRWQPSRHVTVDANYSWLDTSEQTVAGTLGVREVRRPKHSGNIAVTGQWDKLRLGTSIAYVGQRRDLDFATWPATPAPLSAYWTASMTGAYRVHESVELTARLENAFDNRREDVLGYNSAGIGAFFGAKVRWGD